jgi:hypothetical protein
MSNLRPDPKNIDEMTHAETNPHPSRIAPKTIGKDLNQLQQDAVEQNKRFNSSLRRFDWS